MMHLLLRHSPRRRGGLLAVTVAALLAGVLARVALAQPPATAPGSVSFLYLQGTDTIAVETVTPGNGIVRGVLSYRGQPRIEWEQTRTPLRLTLTVFAPGSAADAAPVQVASFVPRGDSIAAEIGPRGAMRPQVFASKAGAVPLIPNSLLHTALLSQLARETGQRTMPVFLTAGAQTLDATIRFEGDTSVFSIGGMDLRTAWQDGVPREVRVPAQNLRAVRAAGLVRPPAGTAVPIDYRAPAGAPYTAEPVRIPTTRGYALAGTLTKPTGAAKLPVLITISGSGPQERDGRLPGVVKDYAIFREIADTLGRRGVAVLRYDDRGVGESGGADSRHTATSADFADDVLSVVAYLRTRPDIDASRILLAGHSEGGLIAPMVATKDPQIRAIALLAGQAYAGRRISLHQNRVLLDAAASLTPRQRDSIMASVPAKLDSIAQSGDPWTRFWQTYDPAPTLRKVRQPVLVLQGLTDTQVSPEQADTIAATLRAAGNRQVLVRTFPETNHLFLADPRGVPTGYPTLADVRIRRDVLGALADWTTAVAK